MTENIADLDTAGSKMLPASLGCVALLFVKGSWWTPPQTTHWRKPQAKYGFHPS